MSTAILVDGEFFLRRYRFLRGVASPPEVARSLHWMCRQHLKQDGDQKRLYRIFFYDCPPLSKKVHNPVSGKALDFSKTPLFRWRTELHQELCKRRKIALRLGYLNERMGRWTLSAGAMKSLLNGRIEVADLTEREVQYDVKQMGVDMRIGLDIAAMAFKRQVDQIILVSGDSDFVPAAKLARREGVDFVLDPMWASIRADLHEHIDGLRSIFRRRAKPATSNETATPPVPPPEAFAGDSDLDSDNANLQ
jgi:uncharacterized LabA/DUF88 family protein